MAQLLEKGHERYTYSDYLRWPDDERWELIDGIAYDMSPAPGSYHQAIIVELSRQFANYLQGKTCKVFVAPFDVRLPAGDEKDEDIDTVVQPDIAIICDKSKIDKRGCKGGPDLVVEVISPYTAKKDLKEKLNVYERAGVKEYWVADPENRYMMVFALQQDGRYGRHKLYGEDDQIQVSIFEDLTVDLKLVFEALI